MVATRLLLLCGRAPVATAAARSLGAQPHFRAAAARTTGARLVRSFSLASGSGGGNDNDDDGDLSASDRLNGDAAANGDVNPFERLLLHSQQFRQKIADAEKDGVEFAFVEEKEDDDEEETRGETPDADDSSSDSDDDDDGVDVAADRFSKRSETRSSRLPGAGAFNVDRAARTARSVKRRILNAPEDELDYEHELSKLQYSRAKERKYQQLIHREQDKDRVCRNCGERGHVAKHCLLPIICSNCGGIGHRMRDCIYPDYTSEDEDAERFGKKKKKQQKAESAAEKQRMGKRYDKFKEEFDSQIEEYLEDSAVTVEKRNKRKAEKLAQKQQQASQDFDPVIG